jgi:hypothetical protein
MASPEHIARRLQRLEWSTRYRPVHIATLLLGASAPESDADFLYCGKFEGEAGRLLEATGIPSAGKAGETVLAEFQRGGYFLAHMLDCPLEPGASGNGGGSMEALLASRIAPVFARIRRSLRPKRVVLFGEYLAPIVGTFSSGELHCPVVLDDGKPFALHALDPAARTEASSRLRQVLSRPAAAL